VSWEAINLAASEFSKPSEPPSLCGLVYAGKRHIVSGPPEAAKTLCTLILALEHMRAGGVVAFVDFESGPGETRRLLEDLGATLGEVGDVFYFEPDGPPERNDIEMIAREKITLVIVDAAAGAYGVSGLDDNKRQDAEAFAATWIRGLWQQGIATIVVDHVVKSSELRGKFSIGSERKLGQADVHLGLEAVKQLHRGATGLVKVATHKDRGGHLSRPYAAEIELVSDAETHRISWQIRKPAATTQNENGWRPTFLMQKTSELLARSPEGLSRNAIQTSVYGKSNQHKRQAIDELIAGGYATEEPGPRGARLVKHALPFTSPTSPDLAATSPGELLNDLAHLAYPLQGGEVRGEVADEDEADELLRRHPDIAEGTGTAQ